MTYDEFKSAWKAAIRDANFSMSGEGDETLDLCSTSRTFTSYVEPVGGQHADPFNVTAKLSWRWDALDTARGRTTEEDLLTELLGREPSRRPKTERSCLRVDAVLRASLPYGKPLPMPAHAVWVKWAREAVARLERFERLAPDEMVREGKGGSLEILAWQGEPALSVTCDADGTLRLESIELSAFELVQLPRRWDDPDRKPDEGPDRQLRAMFGRIRAALHAWMEATDHLR